MLTATINTALSLKRPKKKKRDGILSELKYSVEYLQVLGTRVGLLPIIELKCSVPLA